MSSRRARASCCPPFSCLPCLSTESITRSAQRARARHAAVLRAQACIKVCMRKRLRTNAHACKTHQHARINTHNARAHLSLKTCSCQTHLCTRQYARTRQRPHLLVVGSCIVEQLVALLSMCGSLGPLRGPATTTSNPVRVRGSVFRLAKVVQGPPVGALCHCPVLALCLCRTHAWRRAVESVLVSLV